jgi:hypothetical protein
MASRSLGPAQSARRASNIAFCAPTVTTIDFAETEIPMSRCRTAATRSLMSPPTMSPGQIEAVAIRS